MHLIIIIGMGCERICVFDDCLHPFYAKKYPIHSIRHCESRVVRNLTSSRFAPEGLTLHKYRKRSNYGARHRTFVDKTLAFLKVYALRLGTLTEGSEKYNVGVWFDAIR